MAPTPPNTTKRLRCTYSGPFGTHQMLFHAVLGATDADFIAAVRAVVAEMVQVQYNGTNWSAAELADAGSSFSFPVTWTPIVSASGATPGNGNLPGNFLNWAGRDGDGVRVKLYLFEVAALGQADYRYNFGEAGSVDDIVTTLTANDGLIGTIAGGVPTWKSYANFGVNDFIVRRSRG